MLPFVAAHLSGCFPTDYTAIVLPWLLLLLLLLLLGTTSPH
jgi:hypothetical protein